MPEIDPVILQLKADVDQYQRQVKAATRTVDQQFGLQEKKVRRLENEMRSSSGKIGASIKGLAATLATAFTGRELIGLLDSFTRLQNNLRTAGLEGEALASVQERLRQTASQYGVDLESLTTVFQKAALVQNELGASTEQIIQLNEITAAALKITGSSAAEAQGALLQLGQALGSGVVRAEEFNSILEGALPLAQAAARGIDGFGGSVSKLRAAIADGQVTSQQFFEGVLKGGTQTLADAEKATLTLAGGFTALRNEITVYFGEADKANGVSAALGGAIKSLADNLDVLIPILAAIATGLSVGFVTNAIAARVAAAGLTAQAVGATGALGTLTVAARGAGAALLTAFGGPVGVAILAIGAGLAYVASESNSAAAETRRLEEAARQSTATADLYEQRLRDAGVAVDGLGNAASGAAGKVDGLTNSMVGAVNIGLKLIETLRQTGLAEIYADNVTIRRERKELQRGGRINRASQTRTGDAAAARGERSRDNANTAGRIAALNDREAANNRQSAAILRANQAGVDILADVPQISSPVGTGTNAGPTSTASPTSAAGGAASSGPSLFEIDQRFQDERAQLMSQANSAMQSIALSAEEAAEYERRNVELARLRTLAAVEADQDYSKAQKDVIAQQVEQLAQIEREVIAFNERRQIESDARDLADERYRAAQDGLRLQFDLADTEADRKAIALRILDAEDAYLQSKLEAVLASETATNAEQERARIALDALNAQAGARREAVGRANETETERYLRDLNKTPGQINEAIDGIKIDGLEALNDGLVDAITGAKSLGDVFTSVADQIISDLLRIAIQKAIIAPLADALFSGVSLFGGGSAGSSIISGGSSGFSIPGVSGGLPGRASGGRVDAGAIYRINEGGAPGRVEAFRPDVGGQIIPLGQMNAAQDRSGSVGGTITLVVRESDGFASTVDARAQGVAIQVVREAAPTIIDASAKETFARSQRPSI